MKKSPASVDVDVVTGTSLQAEPSLRSYEVEAGPVEPIMLQLARGGQLQSIERLRRVSTRTCIRMITPPPLTHGASVLSFHHLTPPLHNNIVVKCAP